MHRAGSESGVPASRREFLARAAVLSSSLALAPAIGFSATVMSLPPVFVFSKVYQELKLNFEDAAAVTAQAELQGVDCPVRPEGEILPERVEDDLPRYADILKKKGLRVGLLTTAITSTATPRAEAILRTAKKLGIKYYRLGFIDAKKDPPPGQQVTEVRAQLKDLAALNKQLGLTALLQNHSPSGRNYFGGNLGELADTVEGFNPEQIGVAFDIGHALVVHGDQWRTYFERLQPHFKIAYVKDVKRTGGWVKFGQGDIAGTGYFKLLHNLGYNAPISLHIEYDWSGPEKKKDRAALVSALRDSSNRLKDWLVAAGY
jgi:L-ribulose-5-phosphate 3-epimerase